MLRREDPPLLTGEARFTSDLDIPGALHLARGAQPVRPRPHRSIDTSTAAALPGVVAVYTGADLAGAWAAPMPCAWPVTDDMKNPAHYPLATGKVVLRRRRRRRGARHQRAAARDAAEAVTSSTSRSTRSSTSRTPCRTGS